MGHERIGAFVGYCSLHDHAVGSGADAGLKHLVLHPARQGFDPFFGLVFGQEFLAGLSRYDMPEYFIALTEFPLTASGKILKRELVEWAKDGRISPTPIRWLGS